MSSAVVMPTVATLHISGKASARSSDHLSECAGISQSIRRESAMAKLATSLVLSVDAQKSATAAGPQRSTPTLPSNAAPRKPSRLLCLKEVVHRTSRSRATIYRELERQRDTGTDLFPVPVQVSLGRIGWHEHEIDEWIRTRPRVSPDGFGTVPSSGDSANN